MELMSMLEAFVHGGRSPRYGGKSPRGAKSPRNGRPSFDKQVVSFGRGLQGLKDAVHSACQLASEQGADVPEEASCLHSGKSPRNGGQSSRPSSCKKARGLHGLEAAVQSACQLASEKAADPVLPAEVEALQGASSKAGPYAFHVPEREQAAEQPQALGDLEPDGRASHQDCAPVSPVVPTQADELRPIREHPSDHVSPMLPIPRHDHNGTPRLVLPPDGVEPPKDRSKSRVAWAPDVQDQPQAPNDSNVIALGVAGVGEASRSPLSQGDGQPGFIMTPRGPKGTVDGLRRRVNDEIVSRNRSFSGGDRTDKISAEELDSTRARLLLAAAATVADVNIWALRLGGVLPLSAEHFWASLVYQCAVLLLHTTILGGLAMQARTSFSAGASVPFALSDLVLAAGSVGGLLAVVVSRGHKGLQTILWELEESNEQQDFQSTVDAGTAVDTLVTFTVWLAFLSDRLTFITLTADGLPLTQVLRHAAVLVTSAELTLLVLVVLRVVRNLSGLVDGFCSRFLEGTEYISAVTAWNVLQAKVRTASAAVEACFAVLLSCIVLLALAMAFEVHPLRGAEWALTASGLLILATSQILLRAAGVTDACVRISQLVNSTNLSDNTMDAERMYLVDYITASGAGFYLFNVRLGAGIAIKVFHYTGLLTFTLARLVLPAGMQL